MGLPFLYLNVTQLVKRYNVLSLGALIAIDNGKFDALSFFQRAVAFTENCAVVYENVTTRVTFDETIALTCIEPLNDTSFLLCHERFSFHLEFHCGRAFRTMLG